MSHLVGRADDGASNTASIDLAGPRRVPAVNDSRLLWLPQHLVPGLGDRAGSCCERLARRELPPILILVADQDLVIQVVDLDRDLLHVRWKREEGGA